MTASVIDTQNLSLGLHSDDPHVLAQQSVQLWELLADELIPLVGGKGFAILYTRSLHLTQPAFPWLAFGGQAAAGTPAFADLKKCLEERPIAEAQAASKALFATFYDMLAVLIGESLTTAIFGAVWRCDPSPNEEQPS